MRKLWSIVLTICLFNTALLPVFAVDDHANSDVLVPIETETEGLENKIIEQKNAGENNEVNQATDVAEVQPEQAPLQAEQAEATTAPAIKMLRDGDTGQFGDFSYRILNGSYVEITGYTGGNVSVTLPDMINGYRVQRVGAGAFQNNQALSDITLSQYIESVGSNAFKNCTNLMAISFNNAVITIGGNAFQDCDSLLGVSLPESLKRIGSYSFASCDQLSEVNFNNGLEEIGSSAFSNCTRIESLDLPDSITTLGSGVFSGCTVLEHINYPLNLTTVEKYGGIFRDCSSLKTIEVPEGVTAIPDHAFKNGSYGQSYIESISLPSTLQTIGKDAFSGCSQLSAVDIPDSVVSIGYSAFSGCSQLSTITLKEGLKSLGGNALSDCTLLTEVYLPNSIEALGGGVFSNCTGLTATNYPAQLESYTGTSGMFVGCSRLESIVVPEGVTLLPSYVFSGSSYLKSVSLPVGLQEIGSSTFSNCTSIKNLDLPDSITTLGSGVFSGCTALESINYPLNLTTVNRYGNVFRDCSSLKTIEVPEGVTAIPAYLFQNDIGSYSQSYIETIILPTTLRTIGKRAFSGCVNLKAIVLPEGLTGIGDHSFSYCDSLVRVETPNSLTVIPQSAFSGCDKLSEVVLADSITQLGAAAFSDCIALEKINYPRSLVESSNYQQGVFTGCVKLLEIDIPDGVTEIPDNFFKGCKYFRTIKLPSTLQTIGAYSFADCEGLIVQLLPDTVKTIKRNAFAGCINLETLNLPQQLVTIGDDVFVNCPKLVLNTEANSYGTIYAVNNNLPYVPYSDASALSESRIVDRQNTAYITNTATLSAAGTLDFDLNYAFNEAVYSTLSDTYLEIKLPLGAELLNPTVKLNGTLATDFTVDQTVLTVPVNTRVGHLKFSLEPTQLIDHLISYARVHYTETVANTEPNVAVEIVGVINQKLEIMHLVVPDYSNDGTIDVSGIAPANSDVLLYIDDQLVKTVISNSIGTYQTEISIAEPHNYQIYQIRASSNNRTVVKQLQYDTGKPMIEQFMMVYRGESYDLLAQASQRPVITFVPGETFSFKVGFNNSAAVDKVYICSERANAVKSLEVFWDEASQQYRVTGYFDLEDSNYVPGNINVEFTEVEQPIYFDTAQSTAQHNARLAALPDTLKTVIDEQTSRLTVQESEQDGYKTLTADVLLPSSEVGVADVNLTASLQESAPPEGLSATTYQNYGYQEIRDAAERVLYVKTDFSEDQSLVTLYDPTTDVVIDATVQLPLTVYEGYSGNQGKLTKPLQALRTVTGLVDSYNNYNTYNEDIDQYEASIFASSYNYQQKQTLLDYAQLNRVTNTATMVWDALDSIFFNSNVVGFDLVLPSLTRLNNMYALGFTTAFDIENRANKRYRSSRTARMDFRWRIDPSGYVYAAVTDNRLADVTVSAYWKAPDGDGGYLEPVLWDAIDWGQQNPDLTDSLGMYAWDVPEGLWQVKYEKAGYQTAFSEWLPVPPPQTDVNINMLSTEAPQLSDVSLEGQQLIMRFDQYVDPLTVTTSQVKLLDGANNQLDFAVAYDSDNTSPDGTVYAKAFRLTLTDGTFVANQSYTLTIENVVSYAGVTSGVQTKTINSQSDVIYGDFTGNGRVDPNDVLWIRRYVNLGRSLTLLKETYPSVNIDKVVEEAADFTANGRVDGTDVLWLRRYLAQGKDVDKLIETYQPQGISFEHLR